MVEEPRNRVQLIRPRGESAENGKVQQNDGDDDRNYVEQVVINTVAGTAAEIDRAGSAFQFRFRRRDAGRTKHEQDG